VGWSEMNVKMSWVSIYKTVVVSVSQETENKKADKSSASRVSKPIQLNSLINLLFCNALRC
jgi:hypothetical protein